MQPNYSRTILMNKNLIGSIWILVQRHVIVYNIFKKILLNPAFYPQTLGLYVIAISLLILPKYTVAKFSFKGLIREIFNFLQQNYRQIILLNCYLCFYWREKPEQKIHINERLEKSMKCLDRFFKEMKVFLVFPFYS
jgi:hypothetical protein